MGQTHFFSQIFTLFFIMKRVFLSASLLVAGIANAECEGDFTATFAGNPVHSADQTIRPFGGIGKDYCLFKKYGNANSYKAYDEIWVKKCDDAASDNDKKAAKFQWNFRDDKNGMIESVGSEKYGENGKMCLHVGSPNRKYKQRVLLRKCTPSMTKQHYTLMDGRIHTNDNMNNCISFESWKLTEDNTQGVPLVVMECYPSVFGTGKMSSSSCGDEVMSRNGEMVQSIHAEPNQLEADDQTIRPMEMDKSKCIYKRWTGFVKNQDVFLGACADRNSPNPAKSGRYTFTIDAANKHVKLQGSIDKNPGRPFCLRVQNTQRTGSQRITVQQCDDSDEKNNLVYENVRLYVDSNRRLCVAYKYKTFATAGSAPLIAVSCMAGEFDVLNQPNRCMCENGRGAFGDDCSENGAMVCSMCNPGYSMNNETMGCDMEEMDNDNNMGSGSGNMDGDDEAMKGHMMCQNLYGNTHMAPEMSNMETGEAVCHECYSECCAKFDEMEGKNKTEEEYGSGMKPHYRRRRAGHAGHDDEEEYEMPEGEGEKDSYKGDNYNMCEMQWKQKCVSRCVTKKLMPGWCEATNNAGIEEMGSGMKEEEDDMEPMEMNMDMKPEGEMSGSGMSMKKQPSACESCGAQCFNEIYKNEGGNDMNMGGYGDNYEKPEGEGKPEGTNYRKRRACNGGPAEECPGYEGEEEEEEHSHDDMGSGNKMDGEMKMQRWTQCTMKCGQKKMMAAQMCMDLKSEMMSEMMGGEGSGL